MPRHNFALSRRPARPGPSTDSILPILKLHADPPTTQNAVTAYGADYVEINRVRFAGSVLFAPTGPVQPWPVDAFEALQLEHFDALLQLRPDLVLLGTGSRHRFPEARLLARLASAGVGLEAMDTRAACRTYNILMAEGRNVAAALLVEGTGATAPTTEGKG